jgi:predicted ester cyclase
MRLWDDAWECAAVKDPRADRASFGALVRRAGKVAVRLRFRGTHSGEFLGFGSTGRTIEYVSHEFDRIADGLIAEEWICSGSPASAP